MSRTAVGTLLSVAVVLAACSKTPPPLSFDGPELERELEALQGTWLRGDTACRISIEGAQFLETCPDPQRLLYGDKWYSITFPRLGTIRLSEGGSYHEYGYARDGRDVYIGAGGAGVVRGGVLIAVPFRTRTALVAKGERCTRRDLDDLDAGAEAIECAVTRQGRAVRVVFDVEGESSFEQIGVVAVSEAVERGKLYSAHGM